MGENLVRAKRDWPLKIFILKVLQVMEKTYRRTMHFFEDCKRICSFEIFIKYINLV